MFRPSAEISVHLREINLRKIPYDINLLREINLRVYINPLYSPFQRIIS